MNDLYEKLDLLPDTYLYLVILILNTDMKNTINKQLLYEAETWKRWLDFMKTELVFMNNRLIQLLKENADVNLLEDIEHYQNVFIETDKTLDLFRYDVGRQIELVRKNHEISITKLYEKLSNQKKLRKEIGMAEKLFIKIKLAFNLSFTDKLTKKIKEN